MTNRASESVNRKPLELSRKFNNLAKFLGITVTEVFYKHYK